MDPINRIKQGVKNYLESAGVTRDVLRDDKDYQTIDSFVEFVVDRPSKWFARREAAFQAKVQRLALQRAEARRNGSLREHKPTEFCYLG